LESEHHPEEEDGDLESFKANWIEELKHNVIPDNLLDDFQSIPLLLIENFIIPSFSEILSKKKIAALIEKRNELFYFHHHLLDHRPPSEIRLDRSLSERKFI